MPINLHCSWQCNFKIKFQETDFTSRFSDYFSDVKFTLGPNAEELKAHKLFLLTASPVFYDLFAESLGNDASSVLNIKIEAISKATMTEICHFAYSVVVNLNNENMQEVLFAAPKFQMKFLIEKTIFNFFKYKLGRKSSCKSINNKINRKKSTIFS